MKRLSIRLDPFVDFPLDVCTQRLVGLVDKVEIRAAEIANRLPDVETNVADS
jgi:hypothetical protein